MASRKPTADSVSLAHLVTDYRRALAALQDLTEEFASRLRGTELAIDQPGASRLADLRGVLEVTCLGAFSVRFEGRDIDLPASSRPVAVLKVLADRGGRPLSRDQLVELLWPGVPPDAGANRLRVAVHSLRQTLGDGVDLVAFEQGAYRLRAERIELDAERFETLVEAGRALAQQDNVEGARRLYEEAERLYRGDYFEDDPFEEWAVVRRQHLRDLYLNLLVKLAILAMERADYDACVSYGHAIVREDVSSEDAYRLLMLAHARLGNRARALRWYELCEQALRRELDLAPSAATERLRHEIATDGSADGRSVRERLGLGALGGLLAALGGVGASQKVAVAVAAAMLAVLTSTSGDVPSRGAVSIRVADAAEVGAVRPSMPAATIGHHEQDDDAAARPPVAASRVEDVQPDRVPGSQAGSAPAAASVPSVPADQPQTTPAPMTAPAAPPASDASTSVSGPPEQAGPPPHAGPKAGQGSAPSHAGPPAHAGAKSELGGGPPAWSDPPGHAEPPVAAGPPTHAGPPEATAPGGAPVAFMFVTPPPPDDGTVAPSPGAPEHAGPKGGQGGAPEHAGPNAPADPPGTSPE